MAVHVFPIESVRESILGGDSIANVYRMARSYLSVHGQSGETDDKYMVCKDVNAVKQAVNAFRQWSKQLLDSDPKILWLSLHGKPVQNPDCVGTQGLSASYSNGDPEAEVVQWASVFEELCGNVPQNTIVLSDVCWGASPTAPARLTCKGAKNPTLFFGPVRISHRLELDTAAGLVFGLLSQGFPPNIKDAKAIVKQLNLCFPAVAGNGKPCYRVWWWENDGKINRYPDV